MLNNSNSKQNSGVKPGSISVSRPINNVFKEVLIRKTNYEFNDEILGSYWKKMLANS